MRWVENLYLLPETSSPMLTTSPDISAELANALLTHYSFDLSGYTASELIQRWQTQYPLDWLHLAVIEALYQGRYKGISVQQILAFWQRRGQVIYHFNMEFERLICSKFPESLTAVASPVLPPIKQQIVFEKVTNSQSSSVAANAAPAQVSHGYQEKKTTALQLLNAKEPETLGEEKETRVASVLAASTLKVVSSGVKSRLTSQQINSPSPNSRQLTKLLPPAANHPPIGQFTPENSDRPDSFTSKLKAMSGEHSLQRVYDQAEVNSTNSNLF